jgi:hypothetical protein
VHLDEHEIAAENRSSPGVLLASGTLREGNCRNHHRLYPGSAWHIDTAMTHWAEAHNPFAYGPNADWLSLIPFLALCGYS